MYYIIQKTLHISHLYICTSFHKMSMLTIKMLSVLYGDAGPDPTLVLFNLGFHDLVFYVFNMTDCQYFYLYFFSDVQRRKLICLYNTLRMASYSWQEDIEKACMRNVVVCVCIGVTWVCFLVRQLAERSEAKKCQGCPGFKKNGRLKRIFQSLNE